ncbi:hypothetical protein KY341_02995 [Candidatus Woesearchaeota archaeon]|nr:hypothetical protein [Candidatus Woesearchaeota archaeon]
MALDNQVQKDYYLIQRKNDSIIAVKPKALKEKPVKLEKKDLKPLRGPIPMFHADYNSVIERFPRFVVSSEKREGCRANAFEIITPRGYKSEDKLVQFYEIEKLYH